MKVQPGADNDAVVGYRDLCDDVGVGFVQANKVFNKFIFEESNSLFLVFEIVEK